jgi:hypothetical protein
MNDGKKDYWNCSEKELIEKLRPGTCSNSQVWVYISNILNYKIAEKNSLIIRRLIWATWGLVLITEILVVVTFFK